MTELTDAEVRAMIEQIDRFRDELRDAINQTIVDRENNCAEAQRRTLRRIAETLDAVPDTMLYNLAILDVATSGLTIEGVKLHLLAAGGGPTLDYADATALLVEFTPMVDAVLKRRIN